MHHFLPYPLDIFVIGCWLIVFSFSILSCLIIRARYSHPKPPAASESLVQQPLVSILRPLKGIDVNLVENLESSFRQTYKNIHIYFLVEDPKDPAVNCVNYLINKYPNVRATVLINQIQHCVNPKVNNLIAGYAAAKSDIIWIIDSNVRLSEDATGHSVDLISQKDVGLVHHLPAGTNPLSFGSRLELSFLNCVHAKMYLAINWVSVASCLIGKSNMFRKSDLEKAGGIKVFGKYMSEDNFIGKHLWGLGLKHKMTTDLAFQSLGANSLIDFFSRRARWNRIRKYAVPVATLVEPFSEYLTLGLSFSYTLNHYGFNPFIVFALHTVGWIATDYYMMSILAPTEACTLAFWSAWAFREITAFPLYCFAMAGSAVEWRGKSYKLWSDGTVVLKSRMSPAIPEKLKDDDSDIDKRHDRSRKVFLDNQKLEVERNKVRREYT